MLRMSRIREFNTPTYMYVIILVGLINMIANRSFHGMMFFAGVSFMAVYGEVRSIYIRAKAINDEKAMGMQDD